MKRIAAALGLLLVLAAIFLLFRERREEGRRGADSARVEGPGAPAGSLPPAVELRGRRSATSPGSESASPSPTDTTVPRHRFHGRVRDARTGSALSGAVVEVLLPEHARFNARHMLVAGRTITNAEGSFDLEVEIPDVDVIGSQHRGYVEVRHPSRVVHRKWFPPYPRGQLEVSLRVAGRIVGRVERTDGASLDDTWVWLVHRSGSEALDAHSQPVLPRPQRCAIDGSFALDHVPLDSFAVRARAKDGACGASRLIALHREEGPPPDLVIELSALGGLRGRMVGPEMLAWEGTRLDLIPRDLEIHRSGFRTVRLEDGNWAFPRISAGRYHLRLIHREFGSMHVMRSPVVVAPGRTVDLGDVVVGTDAFVTGRVMVPPGDRAIDLARIRLALWSHERDAERVRFVRTAKDGSFRVWVAARGRYRLRVEDPEWREAEPLLVEAGEEEVVVPLVRASARLAVEFQGVRREDVEDFDVHILDPADWGGLRRAHDQLTSDDPVTSKLAPGRYDVCIEMDGMSLWRREGVVLEAGETKRIAVRLEPAPRLARRVVDAAGAPVPFARVSLSSPSAWPFGPEDRRGGELLLLSARASEAGLLDVPLERTDLLLTVRAPGHGGVRVPIHEVPADRVVLPLGRIVRGRLVDAQGGEGVSGISVRLDLAGVGATRLVTSAITGADGSFSFPDVTNGRWRLEVLSLTRSSVLTREIEVRGGPADFGDVPVPVR